MTSTKPAPSAESFDYIVVGAGSSGCVLANRLTEDPSVRVLLLEAGPEDSADAIRVPVLFGSLFGSEVDWDYRLEPQAHYAGSPRYPRGKTLGGSSAINLMVYIRGDRADFDGWSQRGCAGWDYDSVLPYFMKAERTAASENLSTAKSAHCTSRTGCSPMSSPNAGSTPRSNGACRTTTTSTVPPDRAGAYQVTCHDGWRCSVADAYLKPVLDRPNLTVAVNSQVTQCPVRRHPGLRVWPMCVTAARTSASAAPRSSSAAASINSPQLLLFSGIGPAEQLRAHGIPVRVDVPGVGANLQDHTMIPIVWATQDSSDLLAAGQPREHGTLAGAARRPVYLERR